MSQPDRVSRLEAATLRVSSWIAAVKNFGSLVAGLSFIISGISWVIANSGFPLWVRFGAVAVGSVTFAAPCGALLHRYVFRRKEVPLGYRWKSATYTYSFDAADRRRQIQDITVEVQSRRSALTIFANKFHWTGSGTKPEIQLTSPDQILLIDPGMLYDNWQFYYVHFRKPLGFGEIADVTVKQSLFDERGTFRPVLSKYVQDDMESLTLRVLFGDHMPPRDKVEAVIRSSIMGDERIRGHGELEYDEATKSVKFAIGSPRRGQTYAIEWEWDYPQ